jgi:hypothetical protein
MYACLADFDDIDDDPVIIERPSAAIRKLENKRRTTSRNRNHRLNHPIDPLLSDRPTSIVPDPLPPQRRAEVTSRVAVPLFGYDLCRAAEDKEIKKILQTYGSLTPIDESNIEPGAVFLRSMSMFKRKSDDSISCRIPLDGKHQPTDTYGDTSAATPDTSDYLFLLSLAFKDASDRNQLDGLEIFSGDIPAAFINGIKLPRSDTGGHQMLTRLPKDLLNTDLANKLCEITGPQYGIHQGGHIYDVNLDKTTLASDMC